jgi:hypothetical protein
MNGTSIFFWITLIFIFLKTLFDYQNFKISAKYSNIILAIFSSMFFIFLYINNLKFTEDEMICGKKNSQLAFIHTLIPFIFIYLLGTITLFIFPGWIRSFANTFGLTVVQMRGLGDTISKWLDNKPNPGDNKNYNIIIEKIYNDPDVIINELDIDNIQFDASDNIQWEQFDSLQEYITEDNVAKKNPEELNEIKRELVGYINIKNTIGQYIWVLLFSMITILKSKN